jgi:hypothetical protein
LLIFDRHGLRCAVQSQYSLAPRTSARGRSHLTTGRRSDISAVPDVPESRRTKDITSTFVQPTTLEANSADECPEDKSHTATPPEHVDGLTNDEYAYPPAFESTPLATMQSVQPTCTPHSRAGATASGQPGLRLKRKHSTGSGAARPCSPNAARQQGPAVQTHQPRPLPVGPFLGGADNGTHPLTARQGQSSAGIQRSKGLTLFLYLRSAVTHVGPLNRTPGRGRRGRASRSNASTLSASD